jgi:hypothetical protein
MNQELLASFRDVRFDEAHCQPGSVQSLDSVFLGIEPRGCQVLGSVKGELPVATEVSRDGGETLEVLVERSRKAALLR